MFQFQNQRRDPHESPIERSLLRAVDGGLAAVIVGSPWIMGGRHPLGELAIVIASIAISTCWLVRQSLQRTPGSWRFSPAQIVLAAGACLLAVQLIPLPAELIAKLSPRTAALLPLWNDGAPGALGRWTQLTLTPHATRGALVIYLAYGLLFLTASQRITQLADVERMITLIALSAAAMALFGVVQYLAGNGKFLWMYEHPARGTGDAIKGMFANKNHFAHLLALGVGPLLWVLHQATSGVARQTRSNDFGNGESRNQAAMIAGWIALGVVLFAGLMTLSRGGALAIGAALVTCGVLFYRARIVGTRQLLAAGLVLAVIGVSLGIHGYQQVSTRLGDLTGG